jgi:hypothetical protein
MLRLSKILSLLYFLALSANAFYVPVSRVLSINVLRCTSIHPNVSGTEDPLSNSNTSVDTRRVVIIGAGVGGLGCAARIAAQTENVEIVVIEKNSRDMLGKEACI